MSENATPMPADGGGTQKGAPDGVRDVPDRGRSGGGDSGGGGYDNPHGGKEAAGQAQGFDGGQSVKGYHGSGQLDGNVADPDRAGAVGQGGAGRDDAVASRDADKDAPPANGMRGEGPADGSVGDGIPDSQRRSMTVNGRTLVIEEESGVAAAEMTGKTGSEGQTEKTGEQPGSG